MFSIVYEIREKIVKARKKEKEFGELVNASNFPGKQGGRARMIIGDTYERFFRHQLLFFFLSFF